MSGAEMRSRPAAAEPALGARGERSRVCMVSSLLPVRRTAQGAHLINVSPGGVSCREQRGGRAGSGWSRSARSDDDDLHRERSCGSCRPEPPRVVQPLGQPSQVHPYHAEGDVSVFAGGLEAGDQCLMALSLLSLTQRCSAWLAGCICLLLEPR
jgi:hypothetical protein